MAFNPLPIADQIDTNVLNTLKSVTVANSYQITISSSQFPDPFGELSPADMMCVLHVGDDEEATDEDTPIQFKQWSRPYAAQVYLLKSASDLATTRFETWKNVVIADLTKALMKDVSFGNLAENCEIHNPVTFEDGNDAKGVFVIFSVIYRHLYDNPYSQSQH